MTVSQQIITIAAVVLGTMLTRFIPFIIFPETKNPPAFVLYLGKVLPYAAMGLLVVYCLKDAFQGTYLFENAVAVAITAAMHKWKHNMFLSIAAGTACYMILLQFFVH